MKPLSFDAFSLLAVLFSLLLTGRLMTFNFQNPRKSAHLDKEWFTYYSRMLDVKCLTLFYQGSGKTLLPVGGATTNFNTGITSIVDHE